jgi:acyl-coenzyme A thioesterase PaaI-like protein
MLRLSGRVIMPSMDVTELARSLLEPVPAHRTLGIQVLSAGDGSAEVVLETPSAMTNVIGSLHSSGLIALVDAAGLAAIIGACDVDADFDRIVPLGSAATMDFRAPARGRLVASCRLDQHARLALQPVLAGREDRARVSTVADVVDEGRALVCRGTFEWSVRRLPVSG